MQRNTLSPLPIKRSQYTYGCAVSDGTDIGLDFLVLSFEEFAFSPAEIRIRERVEDGVFAFLEECAGALVAFLIGVAVLFGLHSWACGHIVIVIKIGHIPDASESRSVMPLQKRRKAPLSA